MIDLSTIFNFVDCFYPYNYLVDFTKIKSEITLFLYLLNGLYKLIVLNLIHFLIFQFINLFKIC